MNWVQQLSAQLEQGPCVVVTLNLLSGSAPRESGSRMLVADDQVSGSIGGGNLEFQAIEYARELLLKPDSARHEHSRWGLGPALNQCCGGAVELHFELLPVGIPAWLRHVCVEVEKSRPLVLATAINSENPLHLVISEEGVVAVDRTDLKSVFEPGLKSVDPDPEVLKHSAAMLQQTGLPATRAKSLVEVTAGAVNWWLERLDTPGVPLVLFGAGHVAQEVARLLERLPFDVTWVDERTDWLPARTVPSIRPVLTNQYQQVLDTAPPGAVYVVMTHSHQLDEDICYEILQRNRFSWLGLIGSRTKRRRFVHRLQERGIDASRVEQIVCPVGLVGESVSTGGAADDPNDEQHPAPRGGIHGKQPATIALSLVAQLMMERPWIVENS